MFSKYQCWGCPHPEFTQAVSSSGEACPLYLPASAGSSQGAEQAVGPAGGGAGSESSKLQCSLICQKALGAQVLALITPRGLVALSKSFGLSGLSFPICQSRGGLNRMSSVALSGPAVQWFSGCAGMFLHALLGSLGTHELMARMWDLIYFPSSLQGQSRLSSWCHTWVLNLAQALRGARVPLMGVTFKSPFCR